MRPDFTVFPSLDTKIWIPQGEFEEKKDSYIYRFDLPGVEKTSVNVYIRNGRLIIEGSRESKIEEANKDKGLIRREIRQGEFRREITLPEDVDENGTIQSTLKNGVLTIELPKAKGKVKSEGRKIEIQ
jgi:HSP20 family protein